MSHDNKPFNESKLQEPLRLWPGVAAAILLALAKFALPIVMPDALPYVIFGGLIFGLIIIIWWMFFSRAPRLDRFGAVVFMILVIFAIRPVLHESISQAGLGLLFPILAIPILSLVFVAWAITCGRLWEKPRRWTMAVAILLAIGAWTLIRTDGLDHEGDSEFAWRWTQTDEEMLLARTVDQSPPKPVVKNIIGGEWPGFRGAFRDGVIRGIKIKTNWSATPPVELWRRPIGPGWSSFAVRDKLFYTQEQRGEEELVSCYNLTSGEMVWKHGDKARFWESNAGPGPRGTPTLTKDRIITLGGTGILNVLNIADGSVVWSRNAGEDTDTKVPFWGFSSSPLVVDDAIIVAAACSLIAYDMKTGDPLWSKPAEGDCYSSPHLLKVNGISQILLQNDSGAISVSPADGSLLWKHEWPGHPIVQPALTSEGDILLSTSDTTGIRRIGVTNEWTIEERWTSDHIKPYFNDSVIHNGFVYGFDGRALACIDIKDGSRKWKGGRYGRGQMVLLADQDLLLVLSDKGKLALVKAIPDSFTELAQFLAIKGKTWNHPVLVGNVLLVRNAREMAAFQVTPI